MPFRLRDEIEKEIVRWSKVESGVGIALWDEQATQDPGEGEKFPKPYLSLKIISGPLPISERRVEPVGNQPGDIDKFEISKVFQFTLNVAIVADKSENLKILNDLQMSLEKDTVRENFNRNGFTFIETANILDDTTLLSTMYELRANMDIMFNFTSVIIDEPGEVHEVSIGRTINGEVLDPIEININ